MYFSTVPDLHSIIIKYVLYIYKIHLRANFTQERPKTIVTWSAVGFINVYYSDFNNFRFTGVLCEAIEGYTSESRPRVQKQSSWRVTDTKS